jgi:hypothetical protein
MDVQAILPCMDWSGPWWLIVLGFALALLIGTAVYARRSRRSGFFGAAARLGLAPFLGPVPFNPEERKGFNLFSRGYSATWTNLMVDNPDVPSALLFDFSYRFGLRIIASVGYSQTVAAFSARLTSLPDFQLTPTTSLERMAPKLGLQGLYFESRPEFRKRYWLRARDEISVRAIFTDTRIDHLAASDPQAMWYVEKIGRWLLVYSHGRTYSPADLPGFFVAARAMADLFLATR